MLAKKRFFTNNLIYFLFCNFLASPAFAEDLSKNSDHKIFPPKARIYYNSAVALQQAGFLHAAIGDYKHAIEIDPEMPDAFCNLGTIYVAQKKYDSAKSVLYKAVSIGRTHQEKNSCRILSLTLLANILCLDGQNAEAENLYIEAIDLREGVTLESGIVDALDNYAELLSKTNRQIEAQAMRKRADNLRNSKIPT